MTTTEIREALHEVAAAVPAPAQDRVAFQDRVRAERRRRTGRRAIAVVAAAAVAGLVGTLAVSGPLGDGRGTDVADAPDGPAAGPTAPVPVALEGRLAVVAADGGVARSDLRVVEILGTTAEGVVVIDRNRHVRLVPVTGSGARTTFGRPRDLVGDAVQSAHLDKQGLVLGFVDRDDTLHFREVGVLSDYQTDLLEPDDTVLGINGGAYVTRSQAAGLVLHYRDEREQSVVEFASRQVASSFPAIVAELADLTLAVGTSDGVEVFDASPAATPRFGGSLGGSVTSLAPGGDLVATATGSEQSDQGMSVGVWLLDAITGEQVPMHDYEGGPAGDVAWVDDDEFAVLAGSGGDELWVCSAVDRRCEERLSGPVGTVRLPLD
jgi:hypothetical protein